MNSEQTSNNVRPLYLNSVLGRRQFCEIVSTLLAGLIINPQPIWLVSAWVSDFDLLDNRTGEWSSLQPAWGLKTIRFSEMLSECIDSGCLLNLVTKDLESNEAFLNRLINLSNTSPNLKYGYTEDLHIKGMLTNDWFISGSMNFTYSGVNRNDEQLQLTTQPSLISETWLEYEHRYTSVLT